MAWPPPVLPVNRADATPSLTTHAADHNALALAVNDIVAYLQSRWSYFAMSSAATQPIPNGTWTLGGVGTTEASNGTNVVAWGGSKGAKVNRAGRYLIAGGVQFPASATGRRGIGFCLNPDVPAYHERRVMLPATATGVMPVMFAIPLQLAVGQGAGVMIYQDSGTAMDISGAYISITELG